MITAIDDALKVVREMPPLQNKDEERCLTLTHKEDDLLTLLDDFTKAGYSPGVSFDSGSVTALKLDLNKI